MTGRPLPMISMTSIACAALVVLWSHHAAAPAGAAAVAAARGALVADAAERQDREAVRALLARGTSASVPQPDGATALHWAVHWNDAEMVDLLLKHGAGTDHVTDLGVAPLTLACQNGSGAMVRKLLDGGANARAALPSGETALMTCARSGSLDGVDALLARKADPHARVTDAHAQTALMWAAAEGHGDVVARLLTAGAAPDARTAVSKPEDGAGPITPTPETIANGTYQPLSRPIFIYVNAKSLAKPEVKEFVEYYLKDAPKIAKEVKYVPLPAQAYKINLEHLAKGKKGTVFGGASEVGITIEALLAREAKL